MAPVLELRVWTIFYDTLDHPGVFAVRAFRLDNGSVVPENFCLVFRSLEAARESVPAGMYRIPRQANDDPKIVETWL